MSDELYSPNHANHARDMRDEHDARSWEHAGSDAATANPLSSDLAALDERLATDGAHWQRRLPPIEQVAERIRAIPWTTPTAMTPTTPEHTRGDAHMTPFEDEPTDRLSSASVDAQRLGLGERRANRSGRILALVAAVVIVALLGAVFAALAQRSHQNGGHPSSTPIVKRATATPTRAPTATNTPAGSTVPGTWNLVASPDTSGALSGIVAVSATDLWAVGYNNESNGPTTLIEHSDGTSWQIVSSPSPSTTDALNAVAAVSANDVWAVGNSGANTLIEHWDGAQWSVVPSPSPSAAGNYLYGVTALASDNIWAAGYDITGQGCGQIPEPLIEHWNGSAWRVATTPQVPSQYGAKLYAISADSANDVWTVGQVVEHFDGSAWSLVNTPTQVGLFGVAALGPGDVWGVGVTSDDTPAVTHWNGSQLTTVASPKPSSLAQTTLLGISGVNAKDIWAVGGNPPLGCSGVSLPLIEHWNGQAWSVVPAATTSGLQGYLDAVVAVSANNVWAVGQQYGQSITQHSLIEHYTN